MKEKLIVQMLLKPDHLSRNFQFNTLLQNFFIILDFNRQKNVIYQNKNLDLLKREKRNVITIEKQ